MKYVLGFDGGGTKTECVVMDTEKTVRARGGSGASNPTRVGFRGALAAVSEAARRATQEAQVSLEEVAGLCAGLAGTAATEAARKMKELLMEEFPGKLVHVCTDLELTLEATGEGPAIVLVAGTGSAAIGRDIQGRIARVGGHGPLLGDEGSAYDIGKRAAIAAFREYDRSGATTELGAKILQELRMNDWHELQTLVHAAPDDVFPKIFPLVGKVADEGHAGAREILQLAAAELAGLVKDLVDRLELRGQRFLLVKSGGTVHRSGYFDEQVDQRLRDAAPKAEFGTLAVTPAEAAAHIALRMLANEGTERSARGEV